MRLYIEIGGFLVACIIVGILAADLVRCVGGAIIRHIGGRNDKG